MLLNMLLFYLILNFVQLFFVWANLFFENINLNYDRIRYFMLHVELSVNIALNLHFIQLNKNYFTYWAAYFKAYDAYDNSV